MSLCQARSISGPELCLSPAARFSQQQSFVQLLQEVNDFAGQRELVAESLGIRVCLELAKYSQEMKQERKMVRTPSPMQPLLLTEDPGGTSLRLSHLFAQHFQEGRRAQQQLENGFKQLENVSVYGGSW
jgi:thyroid hormone receptor interactor 10